MEGFALVFVLFAIAIPLAIWVVIETETADPTVVDRSEAERIAKERGGRGGSRSDGDSNSEPGPGVDSDSSDFDRDHDHAIADRIHDDRTDRNRDGRPRADRNRDDGRW